MMCCPAPVVGLSLQYNNDTNKPFVELLFFSGKLHLILPIDVSHPADAATTFLLKTLTLTLIGFPSSSGENTSLQFTFQVTFAKFVLLTGVYCPFVDKVLK